MRQILVNMAFFMGAKALKIRISDSDLASGKEQNAPGNSFGLGISNHIFVIVTEFQHSLDVSGESGFVFVLEFSWELQLEIGNAVLGNGSFKSSDPFTTLISDR